MNGTTTPLLESADKQATGTATLTRTPLGDAIRHGVPEPEEMEPDILLRGKVHQVFSGPGNGKSWLALWLMKRAVERGETAMMMDLENGPRIVSERLQALGVDALDADDYLFYYYFPVVGMSPETVARYKDTLDEVRPDLLVFDSWVGFLAACGLDENSPTQVEEWASAYVLPAKAMDCTVVILDHVPHEAKRARGATRKKDLVDVQWRLDKREDFDRTSTGHVQITREKDREGWLPLSVGFRIGGMEDGFVFERADAKGPAVSGDGLTVSARVALDALDAFGDAGATYSEWRDSIGWKGGKMSDSTFRSARANLTQPGFKLVRQEENRYHSTNSNQRQLAVDAAGQEPQHSTAGGISYTPAAAVDDGGKDFLTPGLEESPPFEVPF